MQPIRFRLGLWLQGPDLAGGAYSALPDPPVFKTREGTSGEGKGK